MSEAIRLYDLMLSSRCNSPYKPGSSKVTFQRTTRGCAPKRAPDNLLLELRFHRMSLGSQKSFHTLIDSPFFTDHFNLLTYTGPPFLQVVQILEQGSFLPSLVILLGDRYFVANILAQGDSYSLASLQHSLARIAWFLCFILQSSSPPIICNAMLFLLRSVMQQIK